MARYKRKHPMNVTLAGIEELEHFPDAEAREKALEEYAKSVRGWSLLLGILIASSVAAFSFALARWVIVPLVIWALPISLPRGSPEILRFAIVALCMFFTIRALHRWGVRHDMRQRLLKLGVPICLDCGYLLKGLSETVDRCPECGRTIDQNVRDILRAVVLEAANPEHCVKS
jgi:hypothetical protein